MRYCWKMFAILLLTAAAQSRAQHADVTVHAAGPHSLEDKRPFGKYLTAVCTIQNSGKPGHDTPTGDYTVSEKDINHHSNLYENAPMPYYMRLTDGGVGMHAGFLPGYPASHGCIRLPPGMAHDLFQRVEPGTSVQITDDPVSASVAQDPASAGPIVQD